MTHDGMIELDSARGRELGFTSDRFTHGSYLWETEDRVVVSFIVSRGPRGCFKALVDAILATGKKVAIPTPLPMMRRIVEKNGYVQTTEVDPEMGAIEVWVLKPKERAA